ncbi:unnamed protein product [Effrenium voratum]|uniref:EF-hand domain-containing protein n=1 Tax=Effrenium voratum TaxID=2562239 RepID=A0AA36IVC6_9DINO|nr:unnamed protein product [Effrenium voratum]CAJ1436229.1 unnamed protein product [Effrenium voratum]
MAHVDSASTAPGQSESEGDALASVRQRKPNVERMERQAREQKVRPPSMRSSQGTSPAFQLLVDQLVQQHISELNMAGAVSSVNLSLPTEMMPRQVSDARSARSAFSEKSGFSEASSDKERKANKLNRSGTITQNVMCAHHKLMHEVNASEILGAFDESKLKERQEEEQELHRLSRTMTGGSAFQDFAWSEMEEKSIVERCQVFLQSTKYEFLIALVLAANVFLMALELQVLGVSTGKDLGLYPDGPFVSTDAWTTFFRLGDDIFAAVFIIDILVKLAVLKRQFFRVWLNYVDLAVSVTSVLEVALNHSLELPVSPVLFRLLRIGKLARAIRMISMTTILLSLQLLIKCLAASRDMLFWSFCLLSFVQCVAGMILSTLCQDFIADKAMDMQLREDVFRYYGTFTRTFLTMFEILFANWSPACRVLVENVSEWFSVFFLLYRCVLGFAVINVVNSVFVQQTMKTASSDEDLAFRQKQKDIVAYTRKVRKLFQTMDASCDGSINLEEFSKLVSSPKLKFWMSQLELEYHDLLSLFEFLDNGDGQITLTEFIEGAARLRGQAKALDVWRMETKVEVLFEEVFKLLRATSAMTSQSPAEFEVIRTASIQDVFANSSYKHIKSVATSRISQSEGQDLTASEAEAKFT